MRSAGWALGVLAVTWGAACSGTGSPDTGGGQPFGGSAGAAATGGSGVGGASGGSGGSLPGGTGGTFTGGSAGTLGGNGGAAGSAGSAGSSGASGGGAGSDGGAGTGATCAIDAGSGVSGSGGGAAVAEVCGNGLDDDLDGFVDEGCTCTVGRTQQCYLGPPWLAGRGACSFGTQTCMPSGEFGKWGPCQGSGEQRIEVCEGSVDENCDGRVDEGCDCCTGDTRECGIAVGVCTVGTQTCVGGVWGTCNASEPGPEICNNQLDDDCDGQVDEGCVINETVNLNGDCVSAFCPPQAPHAVGCEIVMSGNDNRGCVANNGGPQVYFQEGNACGAGRVTGTLKCSSQPGPPLDYNNCPINKSVRFYPATRAGCPPT